MTDATQAIPAGEPDKPVVADRYRLVSLLGRGGTAEVWRAEDDALGRSVALKLVTVPTDDSAARAGEEARLLARLSHPGLVPVYDAGTDERGRPWVVMELVEGETLADTVRRGRVPSQRVAVIGRSVAEALGYVHAQGLVHRDVKPANVLIGHDGRVRLTDFGIARLVDSARVTSTGMMVGTASYLAPEQVAGETVGPPADVYALGLMLLECLTGAREYAGSTVEVALARLHRQPSIPTTLEAGWPGLLAAMTARDPADRPRPATAAEQLAVIAAGGEATTVLAAAAPRVDRTQMLSRTSAVPSASRAAPVPAPRPVPAPGRSAWPYALLLMALVAALIAGFAYAGSQDEAPGPLPEISRDLPPPLQEDLQRLKEAVEPP
ncbi:MAG: serine/threonine protein kinase [Actinobacteria bacterium]|nr:serine/threonine protein kinase [Actinomycetota bacterium]MBW3646179.1 serine/threonine protein kinase [Actinomycetota bacterium]